MKVLEDLFAETHLTDGKPPRPPLREAALNERIMKTQRLLIRKGRKFLPRIPPSETCHGSAQFLLLKADAQRKVAEVKIVRIYPTAGGQPISGFTHYVRLPEYLYP